MLAVLALLAAACSRPARPEGWAAPQASGGKLYISLDHGKLSAYNLDGDRQKLWEFPASDARLPLVVDKGTNLSAPRQVKLSFEGLYGDPVITDAGIYATAYSGHVIAINPDGTAQWVANLPDRMIGGVFVSQDSVYAGTTNGDLYALDRASGAVRAHVKVGADVWGSPAGNGDLVLVPAMNGRLIAYDRDLNQRWSTKVADAGIAGTPAVASGRVFVGSFDRHVYAVDATSGSLLWQSSSADNWFWMSVLPQGDAIFAGSLGGTVYAFDAATGATRWSTKVGDMVRSRPVIVSGILVAATSDGRLHGLQVSDGSRAWQEKESPTPDDPSAPRGTLYADLLVQGGGVYATTESARSKGHVYYLDVGQQKVTEIALD